MLENLNLMFNLVISHFIGDFIFQSQYIAERKLKNFLVCVLHVLLYIIPFYFLVSANLKFLLIVAATHLVIDFLRVAELLSWLKNILINPNIWLDTFWRSNQDESKRYNFYNCKFGYPKDVPEHIAFWLMITVDQILHVASNAIIYNYFKGQL